MKRKLILVDALKKTPIVFLSGDKHIEDLIRDQLGKEVRSLSAEYPDHIGYIIQRTKLIGQNIAKAYKAELVAIEGQKIRLMENKKSLINLAQERQATIDEISNAKGALVLAEKKLADIRVDVSKISNSKAEIAKRRKQIELFLKMLEKLPEQLKSTATSAQYMIDGERLVGSLFAIYQELEDGITVRNAGLMGYAANDFTEFDSYHRTELSDKGLSENEQVVIVETLRSIELFELIDFDTDAVADLFCDILKVTDKSIRANVKELMLEYEGEIASKTVMVPKVIDKLGVYSKEIAQAVDNHLMAQNVPELQRMVLVKDCLTKAFKEITFKQIAMNSRSSFMSSDQKSQFYKRFGYLQGDANTNQLLKLVDDVNSVVFDLTRRIAISVYLKKTAEDLFKYGQVAERETRKAGKVIKRLQLAQKKMKDDVSSIVSDDLDEDTAKLFMGALGDVLNSKEYVGEADFFMKLRIPFITSLKRYAKLVFYNAQSRFLKDVMPVHLKLDAMLNELAEEEADLTQMLDDKNSAQSEVKSLIKEIENLSNKQEDIEQRTVYTQSIIENLELELAVAEVGDDVLNRFDAAISNFKTNLKRRDRYEKAKAAKIEVDDVVDIEDDDSDGIADIQAVEKWEDIVPYQMYYVDNSNGSTIPFMFSEDVLASIPIANGVRDKMLRALKKGSVGTIGESGVKRATAWDRGAVPVYRLKIVGDGYRIQGFMQKVEGTSYVLFDEIANH